MKSRLHQTYSRLLRQARKKYARRYVTGTDKPTSQFSWLYFNARKGKRRAQGWKIHVSFRYDEIERLFNPVVPFLCSQHVSFKVPSKLQWLIHLNVGQGGETQIGKTVTVYPHSHRQFVMLVRKLDELWPYSKCMSPPSDLAVREGGAVCIRYGVFHPMKKMYDDEGSLLDALKTPDGNFVPDVRSENGAQPEWAPAVPFPTFQNKPPEVGERIVVNDNTTFIPLALIQSRTVIKVYYAIGSDGTVATIKFVPRKDEGDQLKREFVRLQQLADSGLVPKPLFFHENEQGYYLIMEMIEGRSIPDLDQSTQWEIVPKLLRAVQAMHKRSIIHCDIKLSNFFESAGDVKILDFGSARSFDSKDEPILGTRNHMAPEAKSGKATAAYDIYSLGSCLEEIVLQCNPATLSSRPTDRLRLVQLMGGEEIASIIDLCHGHKPEDRPSIDALIEKVDRYCENRGAAKPPIHESSPEEKAVRARIRSAMLATRLYETRSGKTLCWRQSPADPEPPAEGIFTGAAGILLAHLAAAVSLGTNRYDNDIDRAANWLMSRKRRQLYPGLMAGAAGMALALGATYAYACNAKLIKHALDLMRHAAAHCKETDLFAGKSGVVYAATTLYRLTKKEAFLTLVEPLVLELKRIRLVKNGVQVWPKQPGKDNGEYFTGSAHGSAGIAMTLALYGRAAGDGEAINIAKETFNSLYQFGTSEDRSMMVRNIGEVQKPCANAKYCHGTGGFLWSLLEAFPQNQEFEEMTDWAVGLLAKEQGIVSPTYCHGLVGQLDLWRMIGNEERHRSLALQNVQRLQKILVEMTVKYKGHSVWHGDDPETILPGLWVGFTGTAAGLCLALQKNSKSFLSLGWISAA